MDTILESVKKTGRCVIIQEAAKSCSVSSEIAAHLAEHSLYSLMAPVKRVTGYDVIMPLFKLEKKYMPSVDRILKAVDEVMEVS
jgi:pyruvate dehydrogenase E1 component beta subunit